MKPARPYISASSFRFRVDPLSATVVVGASGKTAYVVSVNSRTVRPIRTATSIAGRPFRAGPFPDAIAITPEFEDLCHATRECDPTGTVDDWPLVPRNRHPVRRKRPSRMSTAGHLRRGWRGRRLRRA